MRSHRINQAPRRSVFINLKFLGGQIIDTRLLIIDGTTAISYLFGTITYLILISNEIQAPDVERIEVVK